MPIATRTKRVSNALTATFDGAGESTPLSSAYGLFAVVQRPNTTAPTTPSGWTLENSRTHTNSGIWVYRRLGDGVVNGITVDGTASGTTITLLAVPTYIADFLDFYSNVGGTGSVVTISTTAGASTEDSQMAWSFTQLNSTAGGTGIALANNGYTQLAGTSSSSTTAYAEKNLPTSGTNADNTATWTTTGRTGVHVVIVAKTVDPTPPLPEGEWFLWLAAKDLNSPVDFLGVLEP